MIGLVIGFIGLIQLPIIIKSTASAIPRTLEFTLART